MSAENLAGARRLRVLASGLAQLGAKCATAAGGLGAAGTPAVTGQAGWPPSTATASNAAIAAGKDLAGIGRRINARGTHYAAAAAAYAQTEDQSAAKLRALTV